MSTTFSYAQSVETHLSTYSKSGTIAVQLLMSHNSRDNEGLLIDTCSPFNLYEIDQMTFPTESTITNCSILCCDDMGGRFIEIMNWKRLCVESAELPTFSRNLDHERSSAIQAGNSKVGLRFRREFRGRPSQSMV